jgi:hypothetical protein
MNKLLHYWRLLTEPSGRGRLQTVTARRWYVQYRDGNKTVPLCYNVACDYAEMWGGEVKRFKEKR